MEHLSWFKLFGLDLVSNQNAGLTAPRKRWAKWRPNGAVISLAVLNLTAVYCTAVLSRAYQQVELARYIRFNATHLVSAGLINYWFVSRRRKHQALATAHSMLESMNHDRGEINRIYGRHIGLAFLITITHILFREIDYNLNFEHGWVAKWVPDLSFGLLSPQNNPVSGRILATSISALFSWLSTGVSSSVSASS